MMAENRSGVLLLSAMPEGHAHLLEALRHRGIPAEAARSGRHAMMKLRSHPVLVLVDFVYRPSLMAIWDVSRTSSRIWSWTASAAPETGARSWTRRRRAST